MRSFLLLDRRLSKRYGIVSGKSELDVARFLGAGRVSPGGGSASGLFFIEISPEALHNSPLPRLQEEYRLSTLQYILEELPHLQADHSPSE